MDAGLYFYPQEQAEPGLSSALPPNFWGLGCLMGTWGGGVRCWLLVRVHPRVRCRSRLSSDDGDWNVTPNASERIPNASPSPACDPHVSPAGLPSTPFLPTKRRSAGPRTHTGWKPSVLTTTRREINEKQPRLRNAGDSQGKECEAVREKPPKGGRGAAQRRGGRRSSLSVPNLGAGRTLEAEQTERPVR